MSFTAGLWASVLWALVIGGGSECACGQAGWAAVTGGAGCWWTRDELRGRLGTLKAGRDCCSLRVVYQG